MPLPAVCSLLLLLAPVADAANLYKCVAGSGAISYQSDPCAQAATARVWDATPQPPPDATELARRQQAEQRGQADSRYLSRLAGTDRPGGARAYAIRLGDGRDCDVARERRERKLAAVGMDRDYALVSALNDAVFEACK